MRFLRAHSKYNLLFSEELKLRPFVQCGKSTTGALLIAIDGWHQALEMGEDVCSVFLDLSKTFDKVTHIPLLPKLAHLNLPKTLFDWLHNYLCQRLQHVVVNGESSASTCVISGVPQGSVLGPLLSLIYINGVTQIPLNNGTHLLLYADNILIYRRIQTQMDYHLLQQDVGALETWLYCTRFRSLCWRERGSGPLHP